MRFGAFGWTNRCYGSGPWRDVTDLMAPDLPDCGAAIKQLWVTIYCNGVATGPIDLPILEAIFPTDTSASPPRAPLQTSPKSTFYRKRQELKIQFPSARFTPEQGTSLTAAHCSHDDLRAAKQELSYALHWGLARSVKPADDFDAPAFLNWFDTWPGLERLPDRPLAELVAEARCQTVRLRAATDPWSALGIDWHRMHRNARTLLDRPEDWSLTDDLSPHGSDTGGEIWASWSKFAHLTPIAAARRMGWDAGDSALRERLARDWFEIHLALAFGHVKRRGTCPPELARATLALIATARSADGHAEAEAIIPERWDDWQVRLDRYRSILAGFAVNGH